ncbi:hypothetical protein [Paludisphaera borealis]|uniref:Uncharacterized protein n=1 Tax=Paludisphaera borealis TaxID=1387353 RepID=A0A1U7CQT0_9BACT|nr:hypothetical protein [Paludisphaera borealis]APW61300.1 hypothetical protein BSF38_02814 [Paludisphaera borealis]
MKRSVFGVQALRLAAWFMTFAVSAAMVGCGGPDQSTGSEVQVDPGAAKRQDDMTKFYATNPLNKSKPKK